MELKDTKEAIDVLIKVYRRYKRKINPEREYRKWVGKPAVLIIKAKKKYRS